MFEKFCFSKSIYLNSGLKKVAQNFPNSYEEFWNNVPDDFPLVHNEFIKSKGGDLARENFRYVIENANEKNFPISSNYMQLARQTMDVMSQIKRLEAGNEDRLIELAKDVVAEEWGVDRDTLNVNFMDQPGGSGAGTEHEGEQAEITPELQKEIGKRSLMNALAQGAGLHALLGIHHHPVCRDGIQEMNAELLNLYDKFGNMISQSYFLLSPDELRMYREALKGAGTGWSSEDDDGNIQAQGMTFSIICHELIKGLLSHYTNTQLDNSYRERMGQESLSEEEMRTILNEADQPVYEFPQIQMGTELWRRFLTASDTEGVSKAVIVTQLGASSVEDVDSSLTQVTDDPEAAKESIVDMEKNFYRTHTDYDPDAPEEGEEDEDGPEFGGEDDDDWWRGDAGDEPAGIRDDEQGEAPDDWADIQRELFGEPPAQNGPAPGNMFGEINQGLPPVDIDDDDDDDRPFWMN
jgi:hypothetical protein